MQSFPDRAAVQARLKVLDRLQEDTDALELPSRQMLPPPLAHSRLDHTGIHPHQSTPNLPSSHPLKNRYGGTARKRTSPYTSPAVIAPAISRSKSVSSIPLGTRPLLRATSDYSVIPLAAGMNPLLLASSAYASSEPGISSSQPSQAQAQAVSANTQHFLFPSNMNMLRAQSHPELLSNAALTPVSPIHLPLSAPMWNSHLPPQQTAMPLWNNVELSSIPQAWLDDPLSTLALMAGGHQQNNTLGSSIEEENNAMSEMLEMLQLLNDANGGE